MKIRKIQLLILLSLIVLPNVTGAALVDQVNDPAYINSTLYSGWGFEWQQEVTMGMSGQLMGIEILISNITTSFFINTGSGWQSDPHDYVTQINGFTSNFEWQYIDLSSANLFLQTDETFIFGSDPPAFAPNLPAFRGTSYDSYSGGTLFLNEAMRSGDFAFRTYVTPIPIPSSFVLLASGVMTCIVIRRKKKNQNV